VLEGRHKTGGAATTEAPWPDAPEFSVTRLSYVMSLMPPTIINDLDLARNGYKIFPMGPYYQAFPEGGSIKLYADDAKRNHEEVSRWSAKDADAMPRWDAWLAGLAEVLGPLLEKASGLTAGIDFWLAFSPERIDPGNPVYGFANTPKIVGGLTPSCTDAAEAFYAQICEQVVRAKSAREAEMAKLLENTYRHVNIALVNEMAIFCRELDVDLWDAIRCAATKPFGFQPFYPGPGVGGHCIPIDPNYLSYKVRTLGYPFRFVELAQEINSRMPGYVTDRAAELLNRHAKAVNGAKVLLLGVTYKRDIADQRESPARPLARKLLARGAQVSYHDPYVPAWTIDGQPIPRAGDLQAALADADLVILLQAHQAYDPAQLTHAARLLLDTRGIVPAAPHVEAL